MKQYLTINEFAKLRNVNVNSIRYYEKLGILTPARVDPRTQYRYYLPEQLVLLDTILLCIQFGIPLKNLKGYIDENGSLNGKRIFEDGKRSMEQKIADMQVSLDLAEYNLKTLEENQTCFGKKGIYTRTIGERYLLTEPFQGQWDDLIQKEKSAVRLFQEAQDAHMSPVFPAGILADLGTKPFSFSFFVQVLKPPKQEERIIHLPRAEYYCTQIDLTPGTDITGLLEEHFPPSGVRTVIISNMLMNKLDFNSRHSEIQICRQEVKP